MSTVTKPAGGQPVNRIGLTKADYDGSKTTLCPGCGHNAITGGIIQAAWEAGLEPHGVAKLSGIGCSSKTPAYFLGHSHGFNAVHGRMPSIATGVHAANRGLTLIVDRFVDDGATAPSGRNVRPIATASYLAVNERVAEVAFAVDDRFQGKGLASMLLERLAVIAAQHCFDRFLASTLLDNTPML